MRTAALLAIALVFVSGQSLALRLKRNPAWNQISEQEFECLNQALIQRYGTSIDLLDTLGFGPDDKRVALLRMKCQEMMKRQPQKNDVPWPKLP